MRLFLKWFFFLFIVSGIAQNGGSHLNDSIFFEYKGELDKAIAEGNTYKIAEKFGDNWNDELDFEDKKFNTLLFRYRARNWPETLNQQELDQWRQYCQNKLMHGEDQPSINAQDFMITLENLAHEHDDSEKNLTNN